MEAAGAIVNAMSVDVEEHFQVSAFAGTVSRDDWDRLARATMAGHLLECGAQVSGGYYADPGFKDVPDLAHVGYPIAEIDADLGKRASRDPQRPANRAR